MLTGKQIINALLFEQALSKRETVDNLEKKLSIAIVIDGPGSSGKLLKDVNQLEYEFLKKFADEWNQANDNMAAPYITIKTL